MRDVIQHKSAGCLRVPVVVVTVVAVPRRQAHTYETLLPVHTSLFESSFNKNKTFKE